MESSSLLLHHHPPLPPLYPPPQIWRFPFSFSCHSRFCFLHLRRYLGPVSAREFEFGPGNFNDDDDDDNDDDDDDFDFDGTGRNKNGRRRRRLRRSKQRKRRWFEESEREPSVLDQVIDSLWFIKVLKPYGWFLPIVLLSILLASGPKAFLTAFSLPLGFSFLALAFNKISSWLEGKPQSKKTRKPKSPFSTEEEDDDQEYESQTQKRNQKSRYRTWAPGNNGSVHKGNSNSKFGGWDELIKEEEENNRSSMPDQKTGMQDKPEQEEVKPKPSMQIRERELPLLLKLLVALFPFLGSWTSLLR